MTKYISYLAYSIAVIIFVSVLLVFLYFNNASQLSRDSFEQSKIPLMDAPLLEFQLAIEAEDFLMQAYAPETLNVQAVNARQIETQAASGVLEEAIIIMQEDIKDTLAIPISEKNLAANAALASGLRIPTGEPLAGHADYRQNSDDWLREIQRLQATEPAQAAEEIRVFTESYPDVNIRAALIDLNEAID
jgi:hypothetical protein